MQFKCIKRTQCLESNTAKEIIRQTNADGKDELISLTKEANGIIKLFANSYLTKEQFDGIRSASCFNWGDVSLSELGSKFFIVCDQK